MRKNAKKPVARARRWIGYGIIVSVWAVLCALAAFFGLAYAIHRDLQAPDRSAVVVGTRFEALAERVFQMAFCPIWQEDPACAQFDPELVYVPKPGVARFRGLEFDTRITMTPEGLRQQPNPGDASDAAPIVVTGDSYAMGWGVNDDETYSAILAQRFHHATVNSGVSSYGTARELTRLQRLGLLQRARVLVIQFCPNDAPENRQFLARREGRGRQRDPQARWAEIQAHRSGATADVSYGRVLQALLAIVKNSVQQNTLWRRSTEFARGTFSPPASDTLRRSGLADDFLAVIDAFPELAGKPVIVVELKPFFEASNFLPLLAERARDRSNIKVLPLTLERSDYFRFDDHLRARGHAKVAEQLDPVLRMLSQP